MGGVRTGSPSGGGGHAGEGGPSADMANAGGTQYDDPMAFDDAYRAALLICAALLAAGGLLAFFTIRNPARRVVRKAPVPRPRRGLG